MPPVRRLAYRDRFVWNLIQEISGGTSSNPPLSFSPSEQTVFTVSFNQTEWNEVFSALMNGADLTYPEKSHEVVWHLLRQVEYPMTLPPPAGYDSALSLWTRFARTNFTLTLQANVNQPFGHYHQQPSLGLINQYYAWDVHMTAGQWNVEVLWTRQANSGIVSILTVDDVTGIETVHATFDANGSFALNQIAATSFYLPESRPQTFTLQVKSKAGVSGGYLMGITGANLWKGH